MNEIENYVSLPWDELFANGNIKICMNPELPTIKFEKNKVTYTITDIRLLNETAVNVFTEALSYVISEPDVEEMTFETSEDIDEYLKEVLSDILNGITYIAEKKGKNGFKYESHFLVSGTKWTNNTFTVTWTKDYARWIYECAHDKAVNGEPINYYALVIDVAEKSRQEFDIYCKEHPEIFE